VTGDPFDALDRARAVLEGGLAALDGGRVDDPSAPDVIGRIARDLAALDDPAALRTRVLEADLERFDDALEDLVRLNSVLVASIRRDREGVATRLAAVREARDRRRSPAVTGARCDVAG